MGDIDIRGHLLRRAANTCEATTAVQVRYARDMFAHAEGAPAQAGMGPMTSAAAARACVDSWQQAFRSAHRAVHSVCDNLRATAGTVEGADTDTAELYQGPIPEIPVINLHIGR